MKFNLTPFTPKNRINVSAEVHFKSDSLRLFYTVDSDEKIKWPKADKLTICDELWNSTCLEFFLGSKRDPSYLEFNFSPQLYWNAYYFESYRQQMVSVADNIYPKIEVKSSYEKHHELMVDLVLPKNYDFREKEFNISAVIEVNQNLTFWAINHPKQNPDFHDRKHFVLYES